jgi:hypothetical protein
MAEREDVALADRLSRRRARLLGVLGLLFLAGQAVYFGEGRMDRAVDQVRISAWLVWAAMLLIVFAFGGGWLRGGSVRALMEDELTRQNRLRAASAGFWAAMIAAIGLYGLSLIEPLTGREAIHILLTAGVAAALLRFAQLERRALKDG